MGILARYAFSIGAAAALLAGCGGSQPPIGVPGAVPQRRQVTAFQAGRRDDNGSWIAPTAASQDLMYVDGYEDAATGLWIYSYPQGKLLGVLKGFVFASGECVDKQGDVYVTDRAFIYEYAHGKRKRIKTLIDLTGAFSCSIDPTTGNLAISGGGGVDIYVHALGKPERYKDPSFYEFWFCGYDNKGNLFVDGQTAPGSGSTILAELPKGGSALKTIRLDQYIRWPSNVQWQNKSLAVGDAFGTIYQFRVKGYRAIRVGATQLDGVDDLFQFWIQGNTVIAPYACNPGCHWGSQLRFFQYPAGGRSIRGFPPKDHPPGSFGAVVSPASH